MNATIEISLYPLHQDYESKVIKFLEQLNKYTNITVETNGMSTQIFGDYHTIMTILTKEMYETLQEQDAMFVFKLTSGERRF